MLALAQGQLLQGNYEGAVDTYRQLLAMHPYNYEALLYLGNYFKNNGQMEDALGYLRRAMSLKPTPYVAGMIREIVKE